MQIPTGQWCSTVSLAVSSSNDMRETELCILNESDPYPAGTKAVRSSKGLLCGIRTGSWWCGRTGTVAACCGPASATLVNVQSAVSNVRPQTILRNSLYKRNGTRLALRPTGVPSEDHFLDKPCEFLAYGSQTQPSPFCQLVVLAHPSSNHLDTATQ
jgi:hypothetical protein